MSSVLSPRCRPCVEELEPRTPPASLQPTAFEQEFLERLNDARAHPAAYGQSIGLNLSNLAPSQPLTFNLHLIAAAFGHSQDMARRNYFAHVTPQGITPDQRMHSAGFLSHSDSESIAFEQGPTFVPSDPNNYFSPPVHAQFSPEDALAGFIIDNGVPDLGHRKHLLAIDRFARLDNQVGIGYAFRDMSAPNGFPVSSFFWTVDSGFTGKHQAFLTGSVFKDANHNGLYDAGEGLSGVTIRVSGLRATPNFDSGGYTVAIPHPGIYTVTASGGGLVNPIAHTVHIGGRNVRLNFIVP